MYHLFNILICVTLLLIVKLIQKKFLRIQFEKHMKKCLLNYENVKYYNEKFRNMSGKNFSWLKRCDKLCFFEYKMKIYDEESQLPGVTSKKSQIEEIEYIQTLLQECKEVDQIEHGNITLSDFGV